MTRSSKLDLIDVERPVGPGRELRLNEFVRNAVGLERNLSDTLTLSHCGRTGAAMSGQLSIFGEPPERPDTLGDISVEYRNTSAILTRATGFMADYDYTLNPYSGCGFGCNASSSVKNAA